MWLRSTQHAPKLLKHSSARKAGIRAQLHCAEQLPHRVRRAAKGFGQASEKGCSEALKHADASHINPAIPKRQQPITKHTEEKYTKVASYILVIVGKSMQAIATMCAEGECAQALCVTLA
jgi:hypothetical protein